MRAAAQEAGSKPGCLAKLPGRHVNTAQSHVIISLKSAALVYGLLRIGGLCCVAGSVMTCRHAHVAAALADQAQCRWHSRVSCRGSTFYNYTMATMRTPAQRAATCAPRASALAAPVPGLRAHTSCAPLARRSSTYGINTCLEPQSRRFSPVRAAAEEKGAAPTRDL